MTELEKIQRAQMYMDKLANGINPIDDSPVPEGDIINNVRLSRCLFYVSGILRQVIENGGVAVPPAPKTQKKLPFFLSYEERARFAFSDAPIPASEIAKRLNDLVSNENTRRITYSSITIWLEEIDMLSLSILPSGKETKIPTAQGEKLGITLAERTGMRGTYQVVLYDLQAQHFILDNLDAILDAENINAEMAGKPWTQASDDCLKDMYQKGASLYEIAVALRRNTGSIRPRLKRLGLIEKHSDES